VFALDCAVFVYGQQVCNVWIVELLGQ